MTPEMAQKSFDDRTVIAVKPADGSGHIILCRFNGQYATWHWDGKAASGNHGHYTRDFLEAAEDFKDRM